MSLRYIIWRGRFIWAGLCAGLALMLFLHLLTPQIVTVRVLTTTQAIGVGDVLTAENTHVDTVQKKAVPDHAFSSPTDVRGRRSVAALPRGTVISSGLVSGMDELANDPHSRLSVNVSLSPLSATHIQRGDRINLYALPSAESDDFAHPDDATDAGKAVLLARDVRVLSLTPTHGMSGDSTPTVHVALSPDLVTVILAHAQRAPLLAAHIHASD